MFSQWKSLTHFLMQKKEQLRRNLVLLMLILWQWLQIFSLKGLVKAEAEILIKEAMLVDFSMVVIITSLATFNGGNVSQFQQSNQARPPGFQGQSSHNGRFQEQSSHNQRPQCQIYGKSGHTTLDCYHRMYFSFQRRHAPSKLVAMVANST